MSTVANRKPALESIESKIDKSVAAKLSVTSGGMTFQDMGEVMEFAKLMAISGQAVPPHLRQEVGICLAIVIQSLEWRMSPFAVANKSYVVNDRVSYESQLIHAVIEQRAPIIGRLRNSFAGSGGKRTCTVTARVTGEDEPLEYTSPPIETITPKNSPLWKSKPDLQLYYNTSRDWARMYFPDVIMGVYSDDEMMDVVDTRPSQAVRTSSGIDALTERLERNKRGEVVLDSSTESQSEPDEQSQESESASSQDNETESANSGELFVDQTDSVSAIVENALGSLAKCDVVPETALIEQNSLAQLKKLKDVDPEIIERANSEIRESCKARRSEIRLKK